MIYNGCSYHKPKNLGVLEPQDPPPHASSTELHVGITNTIVHDLEGVFIYLN